jgi:hypothetical protein
MAQEPQSPPCGSLLAVHMYLAPCCTVKLPHAHPRGTLTVHAATADKLRSRKSVGAVRRGYSKLITVTESEDLKGYVFEHKYIVTVSPNRCIQSHPPPESTSRLWRQSRIAPLPSLDWSRDPASAAGREAEPRTSSPLKANIV